MNYAVHEGVECEGCEMNLIRGLRFKCLECPDFDLCEECYYKVHKHHKMKRKTAKGKNQCRGVALLYAFNLFQNLSICIEQFSLYQMKILKKIGNIKWSKKFKLLRNCKKWDLILL